MLPGPHIHDVLSIFDRIQIENIRLAGFERCHPPYPDVRFRGYPRRANCTCDAGFELRQMLQLRVEFVVESVEHEAYTVIVVAISMCSTREMSVLALRRATEICRGDRPRC
jgi:hypothetical protein